MLLILLSVLIGFLNFVTPELILRIDCDILMKADNLRNVMILSFERIVIEFAPMVFSIFVFWHSRQRIAPEMVSCM